MKIFLLSAAWLMLAACPLFAQDTPSMKDADVRILRHTVWSEVPPAGVDADGIRRNLAVGDTVEFKALSLSVLDTTPAGEPMEDGSPATDTDRVTLLLEDADGKLITTVDEGSVLNRGSLYVAIVAVYLKEGELGRGLTVIEIATLDSLPEQVAKAKHANGAVQRLRIRHDINRLTLHHSATPLKPEDDLGAKLEAMQRWGASQRNWWDVPYHYIIDLDGTVYEGRDPQYLGDTNTRYDTAGHFLINCYGNYNEMEPNEAQLQTIVNLMAWAAIEYGVDPSEIYGHRDMASTSCPGDNLQKLIDDGTLEARVRARIDRGQPTLQWIGPDDLEDLQVETPAP
ncbi:MAG: peptidoglycan recognition family protein [Phycisphaeraceae bacterium]